LEEKNLTLEVVKDFVTILEENCLATRIVVEKD
jgi:hypothetical protein